MSADDSGGTMLWSGVTDINDIDTGDEGEGVGESGGREAGDMGSSI